jgi:hypothetical protein
MEGGIEQRGIRASNPAPCYVKARALVNEVPYCSDLTNTSLKPDRQVSLHSDDSILYVRERHVHFHTAYARFFVRSEGGKSVCT